MIGIEARGGVPATVKSTADGESAGLLRIAFSEDGEESLEPISWEDFFAKFEEQELAFLYQEETKEGGVSCFFKLVNRE
jgi:hypothetical protein